MLHRLWMMMKRDNLINFRSHFYTVTVVVAVLYLIAVKWLIPAQVDSRHVTFLVDQTQGRQAAAVLKATGEAGAFRLLSTPDEMRQALEQDRDTSGILLTEGAPLPSVTLLFQGHESQRVRNLVGAAVEGLLRQVYGQPAPSEPTVTLTVLGAEKAEVPFNRMLLPVFLFTDPAMVGLIFIAALMFMEKDEGTLLAYLVSPGRIYEYLLSKAATLALLGLLFTLILVPPVMGLDPNWLHLLLLMVVSGFFASLLGAWISVHFSNLSQALFPLVMVMSILTAPAAAYMNPSFSPAWLRLFPTYPMVFGLREALFPSGNPGDVYSALLVLSLWTVAMLALASVAFRRQISRAA